MYIRPVQPADFDAIADLTNLYIRETAIHFGYDEVSASELRGAWEPSRSRYPYFVAEVDQQFAGYVKAGVWRERAAYQWSTETGIYIVPAFHGRGIGKALYNTIIDECRARGFHSIVTGITMPNDASVALHRSVGFEQVGLVRHAGWKFERWHDVSFWQRMLHEHDHRPEPLRA